ncbi:response regulator [Halocola ammonii]
MKKILVIEDNEDVRENIVEFLELANYEVTQAENGKIGVDKALADPPHLILCDIMMPELDGYGVIFLLSKHKETASIPFIFLTAKAEKGDMRKGMNLGADDYITKPFDESDLLQAVESRLKRSEVLRQDLAGSGFESFVNSARESDSLLQLSENRVSRTYSKKDMIYLEGDQPNKFFLIESGKVKTYRLHTDGKELITGIYSDGEYLGYMPILQESAYRDSATALEETTLKLIPREDLFALISSNAQIAGAFIKMLSAHAQDSEERLLHLAYDTVRKRVARGLLEFVEKYGQQKAKEGIPISREDLAKVVGTATETVVRTLGDFKQEELIVVEGRNIKIPDPAKLEHLRF